MRNKVLKRLGGRIRELRIERKLSQEKLAFEAGLDRTYVSGVERGERNVSLVNLTKLAKALKVSLQELVAEIDD